MIGGAVGFGDLTEVRLAGFRQGDNLQIDLRSTAMPTARLTGLAGLGSIDGDTVLLGRVGRRGGTFDTTLQAITDSEPLARFSPCIDFRRLNLKAQTRAVADGRHAEASFAFADGFTLNLMADATETTQTAHLSTSAFSLEPCGAALPEFGLQLSGTLALQADLTRRDEALSLSWDSVLDGVSLQFHDFLQSPLPVERFRGAIAGTETSGFEGRGELALADLPFYLDFARLEGRQTLGLSTKTPLPLLRLARLLSFKGLDRSQRNTVLRQVRRGRIESLWIGSECAIGSTGECLAALGRVEDGLNGGFRIADLALTLLPRAPGLSIAAITGQVRDGGLNVEFEGGEEAGLRLTGGALRLAATELAPVTVKGSIEFDGPVGDFAAMAREALGADAAALFAIQAGRVNGRAAVDWPKPAESADDWLTLNLHLIGVRGIAGGNWPVDDAELAAVAGVSGASAAPSVAIRLKDLNARGVGWTVDGTGRGRYGPAATDYAVNLRAELQPTFLPTLLPDDPALRWTGGPIVLMADGQGEGAEQVSFALTLDGGTACLDLAGDTPVRIKRCGEQLTVNAGFVADLQTGRQTVRDLRASLAGEPLIADGRIELTPEGASGAISTGQVAATLLTSRLPGGRFVADGGHVSGRVTLTPGDWRADAELLDFALRQPFAGRWRGRLSMDATTADADVVLRTETVAVPEVRLKATVRELGPAPVVEAAIRIPTVGIPQVSQRGSEAVATKVSVNDPAPVLLPELDRFMVQAPDTFIPGRGTVDLRVDSMNVDADGGAAGHAVGRLSWDKRGQRLTMDWLRDGQVAAGLFAEVEQVAAGASALSRLRFATSDVDTALISRLLVGRPIAEAGSLGLRLDLQGPWQRTLKRWSGVLDLRGSNIDLTEAQLLVETIAASGAGNAGVPEVLDLRRASVRGTLGEGRVRFEPVYVETSLGTVFGHLGLSLEDNAIEGLAVVGPLKDLQDLFQLLPGLHSVGDAVEALRFAVKLDGTISEPVFERVGTDGSKSDPEVVRTLQDTLRKLQSMSGN